MLGRAYKTAALEYEYLCFTAPDNDARTRALVGKAECLKRMGLYADAEACMKRLLPDGLPDSLSYTVYYQTALCAYLASDFEYAQSQLLQLRAFVKDSALVRSALPLHALILNELQRWIEAEGVLLLYVKESTRDSVRELYNHHRIPRLKNSNKAVRLSTFLPGFGQAYLGYWGEGAVNASLQLGSLVFIGYNLWSAQYFTALTVGTGMLQKFYVGGIHRTEFLTKEKNYQLSRAFNDAAKMKILELPGR